MQTCRHHEPNNTQTHTHLHKRYTMKRIKYTWWGGGGKSHPPPNQKGKWRQKTKSYHIIMLLQQWFVFATKSSLNQKTPYRLVELPRLHQPAERGGNSLHADLVEGKAHDAVEFAQDKGDTETLRILNLTIRTHPKKSRKKQTNKAWVGTCKKVIHRRTKQNSPEADRFCFRLCGTKKNTTCNNKTKQNKKK